MRVRVSNRSMSRASGEVAEMSSRDLELHHLTRGDVVDLAHACGLDAPVGLRIDGEVYESHRALIDVPLAPGSIIESLEVAVPVTGEEPEAGRTVARLHHVAGWASSGAVDLPAGDHALGHADSADLIGGAVEQPRAYLRVTATGAQVRAAGTRPVFVDGRPAAQSSNARDAIISTSGSAFTVSDPVETPAKRLGPITLNRPPRTITDSDAAPVTVPPRPRSARGREALSWALILAPIPIGIVMVLVFKSLLFAMFMVFSPVMALARWIEGRRASKKDTKRFGREMRTTLADFTEMLHAASDAEALRQRTAQPHVADLRGWAESASPRLWERRRTHSDALRVSIGWATEPFAPERTDTEDFPEAETLLAGAPPLADIPVVADLDEQGALGIAGPRPVALTIARSAIAQLCTLHGPADVELILCTDAAKIPDWDFLKWLPHMGSAGGFRVATSLDDAAELIEQADSGPKTPGAWGELDIPDGATTVLIIDSAEFVSAPGSPIRAALADAGPGSSFRGVIVADQAEDLPAACGVVLDIDEVGMVSVRLPGEARVISPVLPVGLTDVIAADWCRSLSRFADPEATGGNAGIPASIDLTDLLDSLDPDDIATAWRELPVDPTPVGPAGVTDRGVLSFDIATDGPHALIAGTTGSGKSELLRSMVASMAVTTDPSHLNFVLIDFKGGGAFDMCAALPHVVSVVTDLDEHLAERALRCLKAELRYREEHLRANGVTDLPEYLAAGVDRDLEPLPRLVVIIDEFATLAVELPDFLGSLVDIAQRGRSLGVHMVLATQRPSGVLDNKIRANTNLRIALRVQDENDSVDVIGTDAASRLSRLQPGRAFARFGSSEITEFQAALVTGAHVPVEDRQPEAHPFALDSPPIPRATAATDRTDIEVIVDAVVEATRIAGHAEPRVPWPDPLPATLDAAGLDPLEADLDAAGGWLAPIGMIDLPDRQAQLVTSWTPATGNLILYGVSSADTAQTMATIALGLAHRLPPSRLHMYVFDMGVSALSPLESLEHCGALITGDDLERILRAIGLLDDELARRRALTGTGAGAAGPDKSDAADRPDAGDPPLTMILIENYAGLIEILEEERQLDATVRLSQIVRDGPRVGMYTLMTGNHERAVPTRVANLVEHKLMFRMADPNSYAMFGLRPKDVPELGPLRAMDLITGESIQVATFQGGDLAAAVTDVPTGRAPEALFPPPIRVFESLVAIDELSFVGVAIDDDQLSVPIGIAGIDLETTGMQLASGEHGLVVGTSGSGRSTTLATIAHVVRRVDPGTEIIAVTPRRSPLRRCSAVGQLFDNESGPESLRSAVSEPNVVVLIDDAEAVDPKLAEVLKAVASDRVDSRHLIAASRPDWVRDVAAWVQPLRGSRSGILLQPGVTDGDVLKTMLPLRKPERFPAGRGFVVINGHASLAQVAHSTPDLDEDIEVSGTDETELDDEIMLDFTDPRTGSTSPNLSVISPPEGSGLDALAALAKQANGGAAPAAPVAPLVDTPSVEASSVDTPPASSPPASAPSASAPSASAWAKPLPTVMSSGDAGVAAAAALPEHMVEPVESESEPAKPAPKRERRDRIGPLPLAALPAELLPGHHALIAGPREQRREAFVQVAEQAKVNDPDCVVLAVTATGSALAHSSSVDSSYAGVDQLAAFAVQLPLADLILVDDGTMLAEPYAEILRGLAEQRRPSPQIIFGFDNSFGAPPAPDWVESLQTKVDDLMVVLLPND